MMIDPDLDEIERKAARNTFLVIACTMGVVGLLLWWVARG